MSVLIHDAEKPLTINDAFEYLGADLVNYLKNLSLFGQRMGQAWFNALTQEDRDKLVGTLYDPFYADDELAVIKALTYLLEN